MKFYSKKGSFVIAFIIFLFAIGIFTVLSRAYFAAIPLGLLTAYFLWAWFDTWYTITNGQLFYKSALLKGAIDTSTITEVVKNSTMLSGVKPALAQKGLIVKYNKWDDIYISPKDVNQFISSLKSQNENIIITG